MDPIVKDILEDAEPPELDLGAASMSQSESVDAVLLSSDDGDSGMEDGDASSGKRSRVFNRDNEDGISLKRLKTVESPTVVLRPEELHTLLTPQTITIPREEKEANQSCKQFWKITDYEEQLAAQSPSSPAGVDHMRVHPKFLHSNATSHKWALGALAELLDNSLDEVCHGATFVNIDVLVNKKDGTKMVLVEDDGGGMDPDKLRQCMSLGYSLKSKSENTIGQYGNGFKTSTMRLGADVIVFSRCTEKDGRPTQSIGMLSYTFLMKTGKDDIVVPMIDYVKEGEVWNMMTRSSSVVWNKNLETIVQWSPYFCEAELLQQFGSMAGHGTRIVIYNLWEDDEGKLELDFDTDTNDVQVRGVNRDEKKIQLAKQFPNSRHFLTYRHSLRTYASILYLRLPHCFRIILRGIEIEHHNIVNDMMLNEEVTYKPQPGAHGVPKNQDMLAVVTIGFVKDAKDHVDVQGFNVYHKNRLIKPLWRIWNATGSDGRGVIGVVEANFIEPAHDKQDFERTTVLSRLEAQLLQMQKTYWTKNCHKLGDAPRSGDKETSHEASPSISSQNLRKDTSPVVTSVDASKSQDFTMHRISDKSPLHLSHKLRRTYSTDGSASLGDFNSENGQFSSARESGTMGAENFEKESNSPDSRLHECSHAANNQSDHTNVSISTGGPRNVCGSKASLTQKSSKKESTHPFFFSPCSTDNGSVGSYASNGGTGVDQVATRLKLKVTDAVCNGNGTKIENSNCGIHNASKMSDARIYKMEESMVCELKYEKDRNKDLTEQLKSTQRMLEKANKQQETLFELVQKEKGQRDKEEENLRKKIKNASSTIQVLIEKLSSKKG